MLIQQSFWPCGFLHRSLKYPTQKVIQTLAAAVDKTCISFPTPCPQTSFSPHFLATSYYHHLSPTYLRTLPPFIHWCEEQWRNIWLLKHFINAILSRTAGRLLTAFTRQHRHIGQPCQPCAVGEPHLSPLRGCLAAHRPGAGLHYSSSCNQASLAGLCCLHICTSPSLLFIYLYI